MIRLAAVIAVLSSVLAVAVAATAAERPGSLDTRIAYVLGEKIHALAVTPEGRILMAGGDQFSPSSITARLPDGSLDSAFGAGGTAPLDPGAAQVAAMHVEPDGQILVGFGGNAQKLQRLNGDGSPDSTFGTGGTLDIGFPGEFDLLSDVLLQPDGRILVVGAPFSEVTPEKVLHLKRYLPTGAPDPSFGTGGGLELPTGDPYAQDAKLLLQPDGRIVLVVRTFRERRVKVARLSADGALDPDFGSGGVANARFGDARQDRRTFTNNRSDWHPVALPDGRIRIPLGLDVPRERPDRVALLGLTPDGQPDLRFGRRGLAVGPRPELPGGELPGTAIADGRGGVLVTASLSSGAELTGDEAGLVRRFRRDGRPDRSFGRGGAARGAVPGGGYSVIEQRLAFLDADTLVAAEHSWDGKYGLWGPAAVRTLNAGYDLARPSISIETACDAITVRITDVSRMAGVLVRADGEVVRRTIRKRFRARVPENADRVLVRATDLAGNSSAERARLPRC